MNTDLKNMSDILKLAKECGFNEWYGTDDVEFLKVIETFYKAAYNKAIEDALYVAPSAKCYDAIKELEMK